MTFMEEINQEFRNGRTFDQVVEKHEIMKVQLAKYLLELCERQELRDHAFGDREIFWTFDGIEVAGGYFSSMGKSIWIYRYFPGIDFADQCEQIASFGEEEAQELVQCGKLKAVERNDMQGDDIPNYRGA